MSRKFPFETLLVYLKLKLKNQISLVGQPSNTADSNMQLRLVAQKAYSAYSVCLLETFTELKKNYLFEKSSFKTSLNQ